MKAYYNEHDRNAAAWLRELIKSGLIADGEVDERSVEDVVPSELAEFTQCHFFAGIGVWSYALRQAGWPDDRPVWTGSCPCQPFSAAGKGAGLADDRHLWPALFHLIDQCRPGVIFGEQVASKDGLAWLDLVQADLEGAGYAVGAIDSCAASVGAPHIRQRLYWVADSQNYQRGLPILARGPKQEDLQFKRDCPAGGLANAKREGLQGHQRHFDLELHGTPSESGSAWPSGISLPAQQPSASSNFWRNADWLFCRDGKWRPVEPGTFPLVNGASARMGRLRGYGNAIVAPQAQAFIEAYMEVL